MTHPAIPTATAQERQAQGVRNLKALLNYWLARSDWTHNAMAALADWAYGEASPLQSTVISRCRNANQPRGAGLAHLDTMSELNQALWCWHELGAAKAIQRYGLFSSWGIEQQWLDDGVWLPKAGNLNEPLDLGDLAMLLAGRLELPYIAPWQVSPGEASKACPAVAPLLDLIARERGWGPGEAIRRFAEEYPSTDKKRHKRLRELLSGQKPLASSELEQEMAALAEMVRRVRGMAAYGPGEFLQELLSADRQAS